MERTMFEALAGELLFLPVIFQGLEDEFGVNINAGTVRQIRRAIIEDDMEEFRKVASGHGLLRISSIGRCGR